MKHKLNRRMKILKTKAEIKKLREKEQWKNILKT